MMTQDELENACEEIERRGWIIHLTRQRGGWWCRLEPTSTWSGYRSFGGPGKTAIEAIDTAIARREEALSDNPPFRPVG